MGKKPERFPEIDAVRGAAVIMMVIYNWLFALDYLGAYSIAITSGFWFYFARFTASAFIIIAGISLALGRSCGKAPITSAKRGAKIFFWGLIVTLITWLFLKGAYVRFGILHLIGLSIILCLPLAKLRYWNLLAGTAIIAAGIYLQGFSFGFSGLLWLGFAPKNFYTVDYFPILPWLGVFLIGIFLGNSLYAGCGRNFKPKLPDVSGNPVMRAIRALGRNSLFIYLIHQPILIAILYLAGAKIIF